MEEQKLLKKKARAAGNNALVSVCTDLAGYYNSIGQYSKAIKEYEIVCKLHQEENQKILYAQANRGIGEAYMGLHEFEIGRKYFKIYLDISVEEHNTHEQQRALAQLGHLYLTWFLETSSEPNTKLLDEAYKFFVKSMKICDSLPDNVGKQDMLGRLFSNLGLVKENLGDYESSFNLYEKSIKICLKHDLYEQLYRGYLSIASLCEKQEKYQETVKYYNLAIKVAKRIKSKRAELICGALLAKSETLIRLADFQGAKQVLRKAYKFKTPCEKEQKIIERSLRVVAGMCKIEDEIITCNDQKQLKSLYEKLGDGACDLRNFSKAIEYYKKMLEVAEKTGVSDKELSQCYFSLGETYKDNGNYREAEFYLEKDYDLCKSNLKESLDTLCKLIDLKETAHANVEEIKALYERGLTNCKERRNLKEEKLLVIRYLDFLRRCLCHKDALRMEHYLNRLNDQLGDEDGASSSSECESEDSAKVHIGDDIVLSDVTDVSEESDNEVPNETRVQPSKRSINKFKSNVKFKKNLSGEWPLHVACIKGDQKMVQYWLDVDHPVNVRDNAGWLPLHEAAVHGHLEIVGILLDHKAAINDRGGSECNGITPLHDAASNGHLEVCELLLDRGASALAKTDDGHTPLFELKRWRNRTEESLTDDQLLLYNRLIEKLKSPLEKAGHKDLDNDSYSSQNSTDKENFCGNTKVGSLRRNIELEDTPEDEVDEETPEFYEDISEVSAHTEKGAAKEYLMAMQGLRHKNYPSQKAQNSKSSKRSALIDENEFVDNDDWLEDDMKPSKNKKRRTDSSEYIWGKNRSFGGGSSSSKSPAKSVSSVKSDPPDIPDFPSSLFIDEFDQASFDVNSPRKVSSSIESRNSSKRRTQVTLLDSGFRRDKRKSDSPSTKTTSSFKRNSSEGALRTSQTRITNYGTQNDNVAEADSTTLFRSSLVSIEPSQTITDPTLFVDVEIEGKVFRVPVLMSQIQVKTIKWLAGEAAHRFASKEYMKPVLELETLGGVILADNDLLSLLFPLGSVQAERLVGKVTEWSLSSVSERYRETCANMEIVMDSEISDIIQTLSVNLDISDRGILGNDLQPLLKAINNQKSLSEINLSGNFLNNHSIVALCSSIVTLPNLQTLNLRCTGLHRSYLSQLASTIATNGPALQNLANLDLSDNIMLKNVSLKDISVIINTLNLKTLKLSNMGLTETSEEVLNLKTVELLDISYNEFMDSDIRKMAGWLDGTVVKSLDVSRNFAGRVLRQMLDAFEREPVVVLQDINLERCGVNDSDLYELLRFAPNIASINLSYNPDLTSISLRRLLEYGNLSNINLIGCENIWTYFDVNEKGWNIDMKVNESESCFKISGDKCAYLDCLLDIFKVKYERFMNIERSSNYLSVVLKVT